MHSKHNGCCAAFPDGFLFINNIGEKENLYRPKNSKTWTAKGQLF